MAVINRYTNQAIAQYNPMSMNELSFAPSYLREKHDLTEAALGELDEKSKLFGDILDQYGDPATQLAKPLQDDIVNLASSLSKQGVKRSNAIPEAMKLKSKYASLYGPQGDIGKLQSATAEYRNEVKRIQEQFKDSPELARGALARLNARQAQVNDGRLELGDMSSPQLYRHIKDEDIMKQLDSAANSLKPSDLATLGITSRANIGNFTDLLTLSSQKGVTPDRLLQVMQSNISPEIRNSILQYAELVQNIPRDATVDLPTDNEGGTMKVEAGMVDFYDRMQRNAIAKAYTNTDYKTVTTKDDLGLERAKNRLAEEKVSNNNWEYDPFTQELSVGGLDESYFKKHTPRDIPGGAFGMDASGKIVLPTNMPGDMSTVKEYKPLSPEQQIDAFKIISHVTGESIDNIPSDFINTEKGREILKNYYTSNNLKIRRQPVIDNTDHLREYGGSPEKATKDLYDNYQSRIIFDVESGKTLTIDDFEKDLAKGKLQIRGAYDSGNPFSVITFNAKVNPDEMAAPLAVNLTDDTGKIIKSYAISRSPSFKNTTHGIEAIQNNRIVNETIKTPNIPHDTNYSYIKNNGRENVLIGEIPIRVIFDGKNYEIKSIDGQFKDFKTDKISNLGKEIINNAQ